MLVSVWLMANGVPLATITVWLAASVKASSTVMVVLTVLDFSRTDKPETEST